MKEPLILLVEDEMHIHRLVKTNLETQGYTALSAFNGIEAVRKVAAENPDLVILDILLPGELNGYDVCRRIRAFSKVPVIMLTAKAQETDKVLGFNAGADDYLTKPFSSQELLARVKAVLRRTGDASDNRPEILKCGDLEVDFRGACVVNNGIKVDLTSTEYRLLYEMAQYPNQIISHADLLTRIWGPEYRDERDYLRAYIWHIRKKIEANPSKPKHIISRSGIGYMLVCPFN